MLEFVIVIIIIVIVVVIAVSTAAAAAAAVVVIVLTSLQNVEDFLKAKSEMLEDYLSMKIDEVSLWCAG